MNKSEKDIFFFNPDSKYFSLPTRKRLGSQIRLDGIARKILFSRLDKHSYINHQIYVRTLLYLSKIYICDKSFRQKLPTYWFLYTYVKNKRKYFSSWNIFWQISSCQFVVHTRGTTNVKEAQRQIIYNKCPFWLHDVWSRGIGFKK